MERGHGQQGEEVHVSLGHVEAHGHQNKFFEQGGVEVPTADTGRAFGGPSLPGNALVKAGQKVF